MAKRYDQSYFDRWYRRGGIGGARRLARKVALAVATAEYHLERPLRSVLDVLALGLDGYARLLEYAPWPLRPLFAAALRLLRWLASFLPRLPRPIQPSVRSRAPSV